MHDFARDRLSQVADPHFADNARTLFEDVITLVCHSHPPETRNLETVHRLINSQDPVTGGFGRDAEFDQCPQCGRLLKHPCDGRLGCVGPVRRCPSCGFRFSKGADDE